MRLRLRPRWHKVLSDLWSNRVRTLLVIASIAVGMFAVGMIATVHDGLIVNMSDSYAAVNPATILITTTNFGDDLVTRVKDVNGVEDAMGVRSFDLQIHVTNNRWNRINLKSFADMDKMAISKVTVIEGVWPPKDQEIVVERNKRAEIPVPLGGWVEVGLPNGEVHALKLVGVVHDQTIGVGVAGGGYFMSPAQGYISTNTLTRLGQPDQYNLLYATTTHSKDDGVYLRSISTKISDEIEAAGITVYNANVRGQHSHPNSSYTDAMTGILFMLGGLVVFLSGFLITNTLSALMNQQAQQIGVMKTVGARSGQVIGIYLTLISVFGLLALLVSVPLSHQGAYALLRYLADKINFDVRTEPVVPLAIVLQVLIALLVPQLAGALPVLHGARVKVQEAFTGSLTEDDPTRGGWIDRRIARLRGASRPLLLSLRNTFRRKVRLALTLTTLTLAGAIFIATFSVRASLENYVTQLGRYFVADVNVNLDRSYRIEDVRANLLQMPEVQDVEGWAYARCELLLENDQVGEPAQLLGPPGGTKLIDPMLLSGRWVQPGEQNAIALSERFIERYPNLKPGGKIRLRVNGQKTEWVVVGFFQLAGKSAGYLAYTNYEYLSRLVHQQGVSAIYRVISKQKNLAADAQRQLAARIETFLRARGYRVTETTAGKSLVENSADGLNTITTFLLIMALLTALVGSIGLMGTMSLNVMERTREIGVMRAIGASDGAVMTQVLVEGGLIGLISWVLGVLVSVPISKVMSDGVATAIFGATSPFAFTVVGPLYWLGTVLALSVLASLLPARNAARITIREALAYE